MVRGCQKKIVYLKNTGSKVFDEAYFVVCDKALGEENRDCDLVQEANKILGECVSVDEKIGAKQKIKILIKVKMLPFLLGIITGVITVILIK